MKVKDLFPILKEGDIILCICKEDKEEFVDQIVYGNDTRETFKEYNVIEMYPTGKGHELYIEIQEPEEVIVTEKGIQLNLLTSKIENMTIEDLTKMLKSYGVEFKNNLYKEWSYSTKNLEEAMNYAWEHKLTMYVFPPKQNLIVVDKSCEEDMYLKYTYILDANGFVDLNEFAEYIATTVIGG